MYHYLEEGKCVLNQMDIPILKPPSDIENILNMNAERVVSIDDMDIASAMQYKLTQFRLYVEQRYRMTNAVYNKKNEHLNDRVNFIASSLKIKASLTEKKSIALESSVELRELREDVIQLRLQKEILEGWSEHLQGLYDVLKQVHYRLRLRDLGGV